MLHTIFPLFFVLVNGVFATPLRPHEEEKTVQSEAPRGKVKMNISTDEFLMSKLTELLYKTKTPIIKNAAENKNEMMKNKTDEVSGKINEDYRVIQNSKVLEIRKRSEEFGINKDETQGKFRSDNLTFLLIPPLVSVHTILSSSTGTQIHSIAVSLVPDMSALTALFFAASDFRDNNGEKPNPYNAAVTWDEEINCYVVTENLGKKAEEARSWAILVVSYEKQVNFDETFPTSGFIKVYRELHVIATSLELQPRVRLRGHTGKLGLINDGLPTGNYGKLKAFIS